MKLYDVIIAEREGKGKKKEEAPPPEERYDREPYSPKRLRRHIIIYGIVFLALGGVYALGIRYVHATVRIIERKIPFTLEGATLDFEHEKNAETGRLTYQAMVVTTTITREIFGSEVMNVQTKSEGPVVFLNEYSKTAVTINAGTTLISQDKNKKYLTKEKVTIPGFTMVGTKKTAGSSKPVVITALEVGDSYNTTGTSFFVSSYTGTKKTQLYARSSGSIDGGESGSLHTVPLSERDAVIDSLRTQLIERLRRETRAQIPAGTVTYPDLQVVSVDPDSLVIKGEGIKFPASLTGTMVSYLLPQKQFEQALSALALSDHTYPNVSIPGLQDLAVVPSSALSQSTEEFPDSISIKISGQGIVITKIDEQAIKSVLIGQKRGLFEKNLDPMKEIDQASYTLIPFWSPFFPSSADRLTIKEQ